MKRTVKLLGVCLFLALLTGCASLLERTYSSSEPHASRFWESGAAGTLRADNYQDIVNDLMILVGQHTESATLRLYDFPEQTAMNVMERAAVEARQETALGAYAVEYITYAGQAQRGYYEVQLTISYRRTAEQMQAIVNATGVEALRSLLETALDGKRTELAVRIGYWPQEDGTAKVEEMMAQLREDLELTEEDKPWLVNYYPVEGPVGLIEFLLDPPEELVAALNPEEEPSGEEEPGGEGPGEGEEQSEMGNDA